VRRRPGAGGGSARVVATSEVPPRNRRTGPSGPVSNHRSTGSEADRRRAVRQDSRRRFTPAVHGWAVRTAAKPQPWSFGPQPGLRSSYSIWCPTARTRWVPASCA